MKFAAIANWADQKAFPVAFMCDQLGVSRAGYYAWLGRGMSDRERADARLTVFIEAAYQRLLALLEEVEKTRLQPLA